MWLIDLMENQYKKGQFSFDLAVAIVVMSFILYFGLATIAEIHNSSQKTLEEQVLFNKIISTADYIVKVEGVETNQNLFKSKAIYHHQTTSDSLGSVDKDEIKKKLQLTELYIDLCPIEGCTNIIPDNLCVNRIVLYNNVTSILRVCGK